MRYVALSAGLFCALGARTQNLVPNPSFETVTSCPTFASMLNLAAPWYNPTQGTPELYHGCAPNGDFAGVPLNYSGGFQYARTGVGFAGIYTFRVGVPQMREYIEVPLLQPLVAGSCYTFSMYVNMPNEFELACDGIGAHFSVGPVSSNSPFVLALTPQIDHPLGVLITDTLGWTEVSGTYTAGGGETHLTIGNFRNDANTTWAMFNPGVWLRSKPTSWWMMCRWCPCSMSWTWGPTLPFAAAPIYWMLPCRVQRQRCGTTASPPRNVP
ncbi:MAG: hypothetical protein IPG74_17245 [Flavobacteriales bacterium]|nr:hypothetical protein [Flavobacteriales bacterium]